MLARATRGAGDHGSALNVSLQSEHDVKYSQAAQSAVPGPSAPAAASTVPPPDPDLLADFQHPVDIEQVHTVWTAGLGDVECRLWSGTRLPGNSRHVMLAVVRMGERVCSDER